jgi:hypothetical protein
MVGLLRLRMLLANEDLGDRRHNIRTKLSTISKSSTRPQDESKYALGYLLPKNYSSK